MTKDVDGKESATLAQIFLEGRPDLGVTLQDEDNEIIMAYQHDGDEYVIQTFYYKELFRSKSLELTLIHFLDFMRLAREDVGKEVE